MVKKLQKLSERKKDSAPMGNTVKDSAQQIWLAGLGAFAKAQEEGGKVFDALVKEGLALQRKTQASAEEKINEATSRMSSMADEIGARAAGRWDKLESIFEDRVAKALKRMGMPTARDFEALSQRVEAMGKADKAAGKNAGKGTPKTATKTATKTGAKRSTQTRAASATTGSAKGAAKSSKTPATKTTAKAAAKAPAKTAAKPAAKKTAAKKAAVKKAAPRKAQAKPAAAPQQPNTPSAGSSDA